MRGECVAAGSDSRTKHTIRIKKLRGEGFDLPGTSRGGRKERGWANRNGRNGKKCTNSTRALGARSVASPRPALKNSRTTNGEPTARIEKQPTIGIDENQTKSKGFDP